jgi:hypothetical protein
MVCIFCIKRDNNSNKITYRQTTYQCKDYYTRKLRVQVNFMLHDFKTNT